MPKNNLDDFLGRDAETVARELIGCLLLYTKDGIQSGGRIVETEAYAAHDPASHTYRGRRPRNQAMYGPPGTIYIYFIYGMHYCLNIVTGNGDGQAVLLRAIEPTHGVETMRTRRPKVSDASLCNGPAKLVQALGIPPDANHKSLAEAGFTLTLPAVSPEVIVQPRIGISKAAEVEWNFREAGSLFTST